MPELMKLAARSLAHRLGLPSPVPIAEVLHDDEWRSEILTPNPETADVLQVSDGSNDDSDSDTGTEH